VHNVDELKQRFLHVWHGIEQTISDSAIDGWLGRFRAYVRANGGHLEQLFWIPGLVTIFSHMTKGVSVFVKCDTIFDTINTFFCKLPQIRTFKFRKVVRLHTEGVMESII